MPVEHYENFPVASILLPAQLRRAVKVIYAFARTADDFADEGDMPNAQRLARLGEYKAELKRIETGETPLMPLFHEVAATISSHELPISLFHDLLDAFSQDVTQQRYANFVEVLDYCRRSANPIGRLLLHLYGAATASNLEYSDRICSALQLINFWQDIEVDYAKNRIYLPQDELAAYNVTVSDIAARVASTNWSDLMQFQCRRARAMLESGRPLTHALKGRMSLELRFVIAGGGRILNRIDGVRGDVFRHRPVLTKWDWISLAPGALFA